MSESWIWFALWIALAAFFTGPAGALMLTVVCVSVALAIAGLAALIERLTGR
jgi:hypothetical protein